MEESFRDADVVYPKSWAAYSVMQRRTPLLQKGDRDGLKALEKECLANNARFKNWECDAKKMKLTRGGKALYMHCLYVGAPGLVGEFERNLKMIDQVVKFQSVKLADDVDFEARQVEADVKIQPVEDEAKPREEREGFGEREEGFEAEGPAFERGEE